MTVSAGTRLGSYEVLSPLGAGGMGEVYRARDLRLGREVALKVLPEALAADPDRLSRFEQEARAASALSHPNIVAIHEIGREGATAFIAMELVDGKTLRELVAAGPMPIRKMLGVGAQVADGLAKAHGAGIVHRDLKPENVMVSRDGFVKILDFGLAKLVEPDSGEVSAMPTMAQPETHPGTVMGTVAYMSPEQASAEPLDFRSDQFSLGSILYEMTTGRKAFQRKTAAETMSAIIREEAEPAGELRPELPLPLRWILERCLAKDREERYASTRDLARDLASVRDHISDVSSGADARLAAPARSRRHVRWLLFAAAVALPALGLLAGRELTRATSKAVAPSFQRLTFRSGVIGNARFADDGRTVVYGAIWDGDGSHMRLYLTRPPNPESRRFEFSNADVLAVSTSGELAIRESIEARLGTLSLVPITGGVPRQILEAVPYTGADFVPGTNSLAAVHSVDGKTRLEFPLGHVIVPDGAASIRFSPDGSAIAFWAHHGGIGQDRLAADLSLVSRTGGPSETLSRGWDEWSGVPCWTANGGEVWFTAKKKRGGGLALWAVDRSGRLRLVTRLPGELELDDMATDGRLLLAHHTLLKSVRGRPPGASEERELSWLDYSVPSDLSPDGRTLLLTELGEGSGGTPSVYLRDTNGGGAVRLGEGLGFALSPDKRWVLAAAGANAARLVLLPTGPGLPAPLETSGLGEFDWGAFTPDGKRIVFSAIGPQAEHRIHALDLPAGTPRAIGPDGTALPRYSNPVSPDGNWVVALRKGTPELYPTDGGPPLAIAGWHDGEQFSGWSADGRSLHFYTWNSSSIRTWALDRATGQQRAFRTIATPTLFRKVLRITPEGEGYVYGGLRTISELYVVEGLR